MYTLRLEAKVDNVILYNKKLALRTISAKTPRGIVDRGRFAPPKGQSLVREWAAKHKDDLLKIWNTQKFKKLPPLE